MNNPNSAANNPGTSNAADNVSLTVNAQYVKDLSFENPGAPASLIPSEGQPQIDINIDVAVDKIDDDNFEVTLEIVAKAGREDDVVFMLELDYAGMMMVKCDDEQVKDQILMIHCPNLLFPFARSVIANVTRDAGFPPLMLAPLDFASLYRQRLEEHQATQAAANSPANQAATGGDS